MLRRFFAAKKRLARAEMAWSPEATVLTWSSGDDWTLRDAYTGTLIAGGTGMGKSSGSGQTIADGLVNMGAGGLVLTAKSGEAHAWLKTCRNAGREDDLIIFDASGKWRFNFLDFELHRAGEGAGHTENLVNLFSTVLEIADRNSTAGGREDEGYWKRALRQLVRNLIELLAIARGRVSVPELYAIAISAPTSRAQIESAEWRASSYCFQCLAAAERAEKTPRQEHDFALVADYFMVEFPNLSERTRSVVLSSFTSMADVLNRGLLRELFCADTTITPLAVEEGKIIVIDLPVMEYAELGSFAQVLWKYAFQRAIERRPVDRGTRPVFLWADEAQHFVTSYDMQFQTTCRSACVATVYLTQNVSNFYAALGGGDKGRAEADSLFGNLSTKILHANGDPVTNEWAASLIGRTRQIMASGNSGSGGDWVSHALGLGVDPQNSSGFSEIFEFEVQPSVFTTLRPGGPPGFVVEGILVQSGRRFADGKNWKRVSFRQKN